MIPELTSFITSRTHLTTDDVRPDLRLAEDIGLYGLDAISFFEDFFKEFRIENLEEFDDDLYISGSVDFVPRPLSWIKNVLLRKRRKYLSPDVTMGHLEKVIEGGRWFDER